MAPKVAATVPFPKVTRARPLKLSPSHQFTQLHLLKRHRFPLLPFSPALCNSLTLAAATAFVLSLCSYKVTSQPSIFDGAG